MTKDKQIFTIREELHKATAIQAIRAIKADKDLPYKIVISPGSEERSNKQSRLSFCWYRERGKLSGNGKDYERHYCKLTFGIPILRADSDEFETFYTDCIDHLPYLKKLEAMAYIPVTRKPFMSVKQMAEYLTDIENDSIDKGWQLTRPSDLYYDSLRK